MPAASAGVWFRSVIRCCGGAVSVAAVSQEVEAFDSELAKDVVLFLVTKGQQAMSDVGCPPVRGIGRA